MRRPDRIGILDLGIWIILAASLAAAACTPSTTSTDVKTPTAASPVPAASPSPAMSPAGSPATSPAIATGAKVEALTGRWLGAEGTYLNVNKKGEKYSIEIANLDGAKTYEGTAKGDAIEFTRNGKTETIKAASGAETGMKGFEKETNCVVVTKGSEGFCKK
ncbi:MAG TPA: hypothetical protein VMZ26_08580 [Pyrinomonadaceae bacterium]|nr:hypothetical protein [Pyrinomonadaceae bacterium]